MTDHQIELRRCDGEKGFDRGERAIYVDGVRWGRTRIFHHGVHGTAHAFQQSDGSYIEDTSKHGNQLKVQVRSMRKRYSNPDTWRPTEEIVLEKAKELVAAGRLRHPDVVRAEVDAEHALYMFKKSVRERKEQEKLNDRARGVLRNLQAYIGVPSGQPAPQEDVDLIVEAMKWAQTQ